MGNKNLVAEVTILIFTFISFFIYAISVLENHTSFVYLSVLIYIIPQLIRITNDFTSEYMTGFLAKLSIVTIVIGVLASVFAGVSVSVQYRPHDAVNYILVFFSSVFVVHPACKLKIEIEKYWNVHNGKIENAEG